MGAIMEKELSGCLIEKYICDKDFTYMRPLFYNHPFALRCELGIGNTDKDYMNNSFKRANEIFNIIFDDGVDALFFDYCLYDWSESDDVIDIKRDLKEYKLILKELSKWLNNYPHMVIRNLPIEDGCCDSQYRNRLVCFVRDYKINYRKFIKRDITSYKYPPISYVSYKNECIMSIYDDRGCDIVFATKEKLQEFFIKLKPYLLDYDMEEMKKRIE